MDISFDRVVKQIEKLGYKAHVQQTGGGVATIFAGEFSEEGQCYQVVAGPGWFNGPDWTDAHGDTYDFYVGPDASQDEYVQVKTEKEVVTAILALLV